MPSSSFFTLLGLKKPHFFLPLIFALLLPLAPAPAEADTTSPFNTSSITANLALDPSLLSYNTPTVCTLACGNLVDATGVYIFSLNGHLYQHPVGQAQLALSLLNSYRLNHSPIYLRRALANAQRLVDDKVVSNGAWFYPYTFDFAVYGDTSLNLTAPWYSGLAQTQALSVFVRLFNLTHDPKWRAAAQATFTSLLAPPSASSPWVTFVDTSNYLWIEEYPRFPTPNSERVLNGTIFAIFGIYDYLRLTGDLQAAAFFDGLVTTIEHYFSSWRFPSHPAYYSLMHKNPNAHYHPIVVAEFRCLAKLTLRHAESYFAYVLYSDYPTTRRLLCGPTP